MKRAFTLIELLVVIAIIAILAAILFPVFAQAKLAAKKTVDMSNLKQLAIAGEMWKADHDGNLVQASSNYASGGQLTGITYPFGNWDCALQPYIKNKDIFKSPLDPGLPMRGGDDTQQAQEHEYSCDLWDSSTGYCSEVPQSHWTDVGALGDRAKLDDFASSYRLNSSNQPGYSVADPSLHFRTSANESSIDQLSSLILIIPGGAGASSVPIPYHEVTTADAGYSDDLVCVDNVENVEYDRTNKQPKNPTRAQRDQGRANYAFGDGHAQNLAWRATWRRLGPDVKDSKGNTVTPTPWRQSFTGAPDACGYREGDGR